MAFHIKRFAWRQTAHVSVSACQHASLVSLFRGRRGMMRNPGEWFHAHGIVSREARRSAFRRAPLREVASRKNDLTKRSASRFHNSRTAKYTKQSTGFRMNDDSTAIVGKRSL